MPGFSARTTASINAPPHWQPPVQAAHADESRLLMLAESVGHMGHWHWYIPTDRLTWSDQIFEIYGVDPHTLPVTLAGALETVHPDDRARVRGAFDDAVAACAAFEFDCRIQGRGHAHTIICKGQPEYDAEGGVVGLFGVVADVTEAFAAIRAIHDQKEMLSLAANLAHLGHWIWSEEEGRLAFCSGELARIRDLPAPAMATFAHPRQFAAAVSLRDRARYLETIEAAIASSRGFEIEYQLECGNGTTKDIREIGQPITDESGRLRRFIATVQDISEAKRREKELARAEEELRRRTAELQDSNRQKDTLFSIVAHDLRSPFNTVMGFADLLAERAGELPPEKVRSYAEIVRNSAADVQTLLDNLLTWAAIQIRESSLNVAVLDLGAVAARGIQPLSHTAARKGVSIVNAVVPAAVLGDADLICIVLRNLVSNGIKFSRPNGSVRVSAEPAGDGKLVKVTVQDDGVGMSDAAKNELFALGSATSEPGTSGETGTGLGLYLCRDIIHRHGGEIGVVSAAGSGTSIHFTLPSGT